MDTRSVTRPPLPSTRAVLAGAHLCDQISALLLIEPKTVRQAFLGEPVEEVRTWRRARSYAERYMAKKERFSDEATGRIWGTWNGQLLPVRWETVRVSFRDVHRVRILLT